MRMARQGVGPMSAHRTLTHMAHFERWAGQRLDPGPEAIDRELLEDYLAHVRRLPHSDFEREARLVSLDTMLSLARALEIESFAPSACYLRGELAQRTTKRLPRFYDEHVAAQFDDLGQPGAVDRPARPDRVLGDAPRRAADQLGVLAQARLPGRRPGWAAMADVSGSQGR